MTLHDWMKAKDLNDEKLSIALGRKLSRSQINRIRRAKSSPSLDNARLLETVTGIPAATFVMGEAGRAKAA